MMSKYEISVSSTGDTDQTGKHLPASTRNGVVNAKLGPPEYRQGCCAKTSPAGNDCATLVQVSDKRNSIPDFLFRLHTYGYTTVTRHHRELPPWPKVPWDSLLLELRAVNCHCTLQDCRVPAHHPRRSIVVLGISIQKTEPN